MPKRGLAALAITTVALILLISFKVPDQPVVGSTTGNLAIVEPSTAPVTVPGATALPGAAATPGPAATKAPAATSGTTGSGGSAASA
jgi:hypothetical protein